MPRLSKRRWAWLVIAIALVAVVGVAAAFLWHGSSRINRKNFERIEIGMTRDQVIALLGEETEPLVSLDAGPLREGRHSAYHTQKYQTPFGPRAITIEVRYDGQNRVFDKAFQDWIPNDWWRAVSNRLGL